MRAVIQRVKKAKVIINSEVREISKGIVILLGVTHTDTNEDVKYLAEKILNLRIFPNQQGRFDKSILDIKGEILIVSQFTLYADTSRGRRPDFIQSAKPEHAKGLYDEFVQLVKNSGLEVVTGEFQANMLVEIHNDGPVTIIIESKTK